MWTIESDTKTVVRKESCWRVPGVQVVGNGAKYKSAQKKKKKKKHRVGEGRGERERGREGGALPSPPLFFLAFSTLDHSKLSERLEQLSGALNVFFVTTQFSKTPTNQ